MRSINTSLIAVLPVVGLLVVGVGVLGVGTLADLALVQMVGIIAGALSSLLLATPILVDLKMRDPRFQQQAERVAARRQKAAGIAAAAPGTDPDLADDTVLDGELRKERAMAAAASAPARHSRGGGSHRGGARPAGKGARPSGKRHR